jgi:hypothetical protein
MNCPPFSSFVAFAVPEGAAGHHIIATSADHSLSLPLLVSLWFFGLFNNHVSFQPPWYSLLRLSIKMTAPQVIHHLFPGVDQSRLRDPAVRRAFLDTCKEYRERVLPSSSLSLLIALFRHRLQRVPISALGVFLSVWLLASGALRWGEALIMILCSAHFSIFEHCFLFIFRAGSRTVALRGLVQGLHNRNCILP